MELSKVSSHLRVASEVLEKTPDEVVAVEALEFPAMTSFAFFQSEHIIHLSS